MAAGSNHSASFDALFAAEAKLQAATWPTNTKSNAPAAIVPTIGDLDATYGEESVVLAVNDLPGQLEWESLNPPRRRETITLTCRITSRVPNVKTAKEALQRVQALAEVAQDAFFDISAAQPVVTLGFDNELPLTIIQSVLPFASAIDGGWAGGCDITIVAQAKS